MSLKLTLVSKRMKEAPSLMKILHLLSQTRFEVSTCDLHVLRIHFHCVIDRLESAEPNCRQHADSSQTNVGGKKFTQINLSISCPPFGREHGEVSLMSSYFITAGRNNRKRLIEAFTLEYNLKLMEIIILTTTSLLSSLTPHIHGLAATLSCCKFTLDCRRWLDFTVDS